MSLTLTAMKIPIGDFRLDIQAETPDGRTVIIENQLEKTDHGHLGQLLVYASGVEATTVIWVAPRFRDDHRRALDWLNERTDTGVDFFGVEVTVVQIGTEGPRAPVFDVVARPNNWQKNVKDLGAGVGGTQRTSAANNIRQDFFVEVLTEVVAARPAIRMPQRGRSSWLSFASGPWGHWDIAVVLDGRLRVEAYVDSGNALINTALFDELRENAAVWEEKAGIPLSWDRLDNKRACRIETYQPAGDLTDPVEHAALKNWAVRASLGLYDALNDTLRARARQLREAERHQQ